MTGQEIALIVSTIFTGVVAVSSIVVPPWVRRADAKDLSKKEARKHFRSATMKLVATMWRNAEETKSFTIYSHVKVPTDTDALTASQQAYTEARMELEVLGYSYGIPVDELLRATDWIPVYYRKYGSEMAVALDPESDKVGALSDATVQEHVQMKTNVSGALAKLWKQIDKKYPE